MNRLIFITGNLNKLIEARQILGFEISSYSIKLPEVQGSRSEVIRHKAGFAAKATGKPVFVEDTALCFNALNELPGPYIADFLMRLGNRKLVKLLHGFKDKKAKAVCSIGYCRPGKNPVVFEGVTYGTIVTPRGRSNFGWDPIFLPKDSRKTYAQMSKQEKNQNSFRKKAFVKFRKYLDKKHSLI